MPPLVIAIHPDEVALGATLIQAAADAVRCSAGLVVAWDYTHRIAPMLLAEWAVVQMLDAAAGARSSASFCFGSRLGERRPGLVPLPAPEGRGPHVLGPPLTALEAEARAGALGVIVSNALHRAKGAQLAFHPGVLRIHPCDWDEASWGDVFVRAGFPTLAVSPKAVASTRSAHEVLELCGQLAAHLAAGLREAP